MFTNYVIVPYCGRGQQGKIAGVVDNFYFLIFIFRFLNCFLKKIPRRFLKKTKRGLSRWRPPTATFRIPDFFEVLRDSAAEIVMFFRNWEKAQVNFFSAGENQLDAQFFFAIAAGAGGVNIEGGRFPPFPRANTLGRPLLLFLASAHLFLLIKYMKH